LNELIQSPGFEWAIFIQIATITGLVLGLVLVAQILTSQKVPSATFGWILLIIILPFVGIPLYLFFGRRKFHSQVRRKLKLKLAEHDACHQHEIQSLLIALGVPASTENNLVKFHSDGAQAYRQLKEVIGKAKQSIDIGCYLFDKDKVGSEILSLLTDKIEQGIRVRLLIDGIGSFHFPTRRLRQFKNSGGEYAWFIPLFQAPFNGRSNLRLHRKMIIVDKEWIWSGGRNISDLYFDDKNWVDLSFTQQGPVATCYATIFESDWLFATGNQSKKLPKIKRAYGGGNSLVQVIPSGPDVKEDPLPVAIISACYNAKSKINLVSPYFIPGAGIEQALKLASLRGVEVNIILPKNSDHRIADRARDRMLRRLKQSGVKIWLIPNAMLHAKAYVFDDKVAFCGSANLDIRSLFLNCEVMSCFYSDSDINWLIQWSDKLVEKSEKYQPRSASFFRKMLEGIILLFAYQL
jgi:cardiolipin synthase A/B